MTKKKRATPTHSISTAAPAEKPGKQRAIGILRKVMARPTEVELALRKLSPYTDDSILNKNLSVARVTAPEEITDDEAKKGKLKSELKSGSLPEKERPERVPFDVIPSFKAEIEAAAAKNQMPLAEFLRRAAGAAIDDPTILKLAEGREQEYRARLSRTRSANRRKKAPHPN